MKRRNQKTPVTTYTSDLSDAEDPMPSKISKRIAVKVADNAKLAKERDKDHPQTSSKKAKLEPKKVKEKEKPMLPITISNYFQKNAAGTAERAQSDFQAVVDKAIEHLNSPDSDLAIASEKSSHAVQSDLEEVLTLEPQQVSTHSEKAKQKKSKTSTAAESPSKKPKSSHYVQMQNRQGPRSLGTKEIPQGEDGCLNGLTFVMSGIFDSITADDCKALIVKLGGRVTSAISGKTNYLLLGRDAGATKSNKAKELAVPSLDDDQFFNLIRERSKTSSKKPKAVKKSSRKLSDQSEDDKEESPINIKKRAFAAYVTREGPCKLDSRPLPEGEKDCFKGLTFVISGIYDSIDREDIQSVIEEYGGRVTLSVSGKTDYLLLGRDGGPAKTAKAEKLGVKILDEDQFYDLFKKPAAKSSPAQKTLKRTNEPKKTKRVDTAQSPKGKSPSKKAATPSKQARYTSDEDEESAVEIRRRAYAAYVNREGPHNLGTRPLPKGKENCLKGLTFVISGVYDTITREDCQRSLEQYGGRVTHAVSHKTDYLLLGRDGGPAKTAKAKEYGVEIVDEDKFYDLFNREPGTVNVKKSPIKRPKHAKERPAVDTPIAAKAKGGDNQLWVEKYKPTSLKQVIGQQGAKSCANKLLAWLRDWQRNRAKATKKSALHWGADDGSAFKAALLSGSPGVGKTTTAELCCKELNLKFIQLNASDARSKKLLEQQFASSLSSHSIDQYCKGASSLPSGDSVDHVFIMDEVDGMSGNEDRAGVQELIALIKQSRVPIICICNDRQSMKVRSLANHCYDLRFHKPQLMPIKAAMLSIVSKEGLKIASQALDQMIEAAHHDVRQVLNNLNMMAAGQRGPVSFDADHPPAYKDVEENIFETARKLFSASTPLSLNDRARMFFTDYSLIPMFVQENYPFVVSSQSRSPADRLKRLARAAKFISAGDRVDAQIRKQGNWSLLNAQSMFSTALPTELLKGNFQGKINFPSWFGKNSKASRLQRQLQQLHDHCALRAPCDPSALLLDYMDMMRSCIVENLANDRVEQATRVCEAYDLTKDDVDTVLELGNWSPNGQDPMKVVSSKTKAAFTKSLNSSTRLLPYDTALVGVRRKKVTVEDEEKVALGIEGEEEIKASSSDSDVEDDTEALLKMAKAKGSKGTAPVKKTATKKAPAKRGRR